MKDKSVFMSKTGGRITMTDHYSQMDFISQKTIETARNYSNTPKLIGSAAKLLQSCLTLCDPRHGSPPGSAVPGILQARTLEWVAISKMYNNYNGFKDIKYIF